MATFLFIIIVVLFLVLVLVSAVQPEKSSLSKFELERRSRRGRRDAELSLKKESLRGDLVSLQNITAAIIIISIAFTATALYGLGVGILLSLVVVLSYGAVARLYFFQNIASMIYRRIEQPLIKFVEKANWLMPIIRWTYHDSIHPELGSREELEHLVSQSADILSPSEKSLIVHGLRFSEKEVRSIMTPKSMIDSIKKDELLGPLVLSELHSLGHSRLPVIESDIDHVIGVLHIKDLLTLDDKKTVTAEKAMQPKVFYIHEHDSLEHALAAFLKTRHHLFIVVNEFRETVGLITIEDVIEALLGRRIVDEDDIHDDVRAVAANNPRRNNQPPHGRDV